VAVDLQVIGMAVHDYLVVRRADVEVVDGDAHADGAQQILEISIPNFLAL